MFVSDSIGSHTSVVGEENGLLLVLLTAYSRSLQGFAFQDCIYFGDHASSLAAHERGFEDTKITYRLMETQSMNVLSGKANWPIIRRTDTILPSHTRKLTP
ncbi:hypothetical protein H0G86_005483 [Trichoderma simmonsii]|uniref:Uncharacterized protein n=1 Tax=Trichoderma simmonsii TaxID=1491479 RepID=A0A8G0PEG3_9HYPO|nr:hypothetical protein H0G86_005483 [Trichoderma simmonsii]